MTRDFGPVWSRFKRATRRGVHVGQTGGVTSLETERPADYVTRLAVSECGLAYQRLVVCELGIRPGVKV